MPLKVKILSCNICHARGVDGRISIDRVGSAIKESGASIIGLQEVDKDNPRSKFIDQAAKLAGMLGIYFVFGPTIKISTAQYGNAILSKYPIKESKLYPLPSKYENRGLLVCQLDVRVDEMYFLTTHLGLNFAERLQHIKRILDIAKGIEVPFAVAADLNARPDAIEARILSSFMQDAASREGKSLYTYPADNPCCRIDYIFFPRGWKTMSARVINTQASDHLPLLVEAEFKHPSFP